MASSNSERISYELMQLLGQDPAEASVWAQISRLGSQLGLKAELLQQVRTRPSVRVDLRCNLLEVLWIKRSKLLPQADRWQPSPYLARLLREAPGGKREHLRAYLFGESSQISNLLLGIENDIASQSRLRALMEEHILNRPTGQDWLAFVHQRLAQGELWSSDEMEHLQAYFGLPASPMEVPEVLRYLATRVDYLKNFPAVIPTAEAAELRQITTARFGTLDDQRDLVGRHLLSLARGDQSSDQTQALLGLFYQHLLWVGRVAAIEELAPPRLLIEERLLPGLIANSLRYGRPEVLRYALRLVTQEMEGLSLDGLSQAVERHDLESISQVASALKKHPQLWLSSPELPGQWQQAVETATRMGFGDLLRLMDISRSARRPSPPKAQPSSSSTEPRLVEVSGQDDGDRGSQEISMDDLMEYEF